MVINICHHSTFVNLFSNIYMGTRSKLPEPLLLSKSTCCAQFTPRNRTELRPRSLRRGKVAQERERMNGPAPMRGRTRGSGHRKCAMAGGARGRIRKVRPGPRYGWFRPHPADGRAHSSRRKRLQPLDVQRQTHQVPCGALRGASPRPCSPTACPRAPSPRTRRCPAPPTPTGPARCSTRRRQARFRAAPRIGPRPRQAVPPVRPGRSRSRSVPSRRSTGVRRPRPPARCGIAGTPPGRSSLWRFPGR